MIFDFETWSLFIAAAAVLAILLSSIYSIGPTQVGLVRKQTLDHGLSGKILMPVSPLWSELRKRPVLQRHAHPLDLLGFERCETVLRYTRASIKT